MTSAITSGSSASTSTIQPPHYKPEEYTVAGVVLKFFEEKAKDIAKGLGYMAFWTGQAMPDAPHEVKSFSYMMGDFKNFISATEIPKKVAELSEKVKEMWEVLKTHCKDLTCTSGPWHEVGKAGREVFKKTTALINSTVDGIDFSSRFIPIDHSVMTWLKGFNFAATFGGAGVGAAEQVQKLTEAKEHETAKKTLFMINLARDVTYAALGALGLFWIVTATAFVPWVLVALLTAGLSFTIGGYFYEKLYDPEGKGKNLNPEVVIENNLERKKYEQRLSQV
jgi:hypothetical protein